MAITVSDRSSSSGSDSSVTSSRPARTVMISLQVDSSHCPVASALLWRIGSVMRRP